MERWMVYCRIQSMRNEGFSQRGIARMLEINRRTVKKYWDMAPEEYDELILEPAKKSSLEQHRELLLAWLKDYPDVTGAQVHDWLKEKYEITLTEGSVRRFVSQLRREYNLKKKQESKRDYQAVEDPPMGFQMQVDIGEVTVPDIYARKYIKLYCIGFVLSNSRYKYGVWYDRPLKSKEMVQGIYSCFEWMGGKPKELVLDQDRLISVNENYGDIIYTKEFESFRQEENLKVHLCRKADPETKGRVEATVKFFKGNFAKHRDFLNIHQWEEEFEAWLDRTGNKKKHSVTKKSPAEVFEIERKYLVPAPQTNCSVNEIITRTVRKDNTIVHEGNRYTLPLGSFKRLKEVSLEIEGDDLYIYDLFGDELIAKHPLCKEKGKLIRNNNHLRDNDKKISQLLNQLVTEFVEKEKARFFLESIREDKPRHARDQFKLIEKILKDHSQEAVSRAMDYCIYYELTSAVDLKDASKFFETKEPEQKSSPPPGSVKPVIDYTAEKRSIEEYSKKLLGRRKK